MSRARGNALVSVYLLGGTWGKLATKVSNSLEFPRGLFDDEGLGCQLYVLGLSVPELLISNSCRVGLASSIHASTLCAEVQCIDSECDRLKTKLRDVSLEVLELSDWARNVGDQQSCEVNGDLTQEHGASVSG